MRNQPGTMKNQPQLTFQMGEGGRGRNKQKRYTRGVTTDLLDV